MNMPKKMPNQMAPTTIVMTVVVSIAVSASCEVDSVICFEFVHKGRMIAARCLDDGRDGRPTFYRESAIGQPVASK
jgi:hypothetical protein